jgi:regulatory protein
MDAPFKKTFSAKEALQKLQHFCAYQERCHNEVKSKAFDLGLNTTAVNNAIAALIEDDYLNEERYAILFAGGKFRIKQWGKIKIKYALQSKQISPINIKKALSQIDEDAYLQTLHKLYNSYFNKLKGTPSIKHLKTKNYLLQKGFEMMLINEAGVRS